MKTNPQSYVAHRSKRSVDIILLAAAFALFVGCTQPDGLPSDLLPACLVLLWASSAYAFFEGSSLRPHGGSLVAAILRIVAYVLPIGPLVEQTIADYRLHGPLWAPLALFACFVCVILDALTTYRNRFRGRPAWAHTRAPSFH